MIGYFDLSSTEVILVMIFGMLFLLACYGVPLLVYLIGAKKIQQKYESAYTVFIVAFMLQIIATVCIFALVFVLDLFGGFTLLKGGTFSQFVALFYSGDWATLQVDRIASYYGSSNKPAQVLPVFLMIKFLWICLNIAYIILPVYFVYKIGMNIVIKYKNELNNSGSFYEIGTDFFGTVFGVFLIFALHTQVPNIFLEYFHVKNASVISSKIGSGGTRDYTYQGIVGSFVGNAYKTINSFGKKTI